MGLLDEVFAGNNGVANMLADMLGGEAVVETEVGETYDEEHDLTVKDIRRQVVPMVIETRSNEHGASNVPNGENGGLGRNETLFSGMLPTANLVAEPRPLKTIVRQGRERYQTVQVSAVNVGEVIVAYSLTLRKL